jgi:hypothetical protein
MQNREYLLHSKASRVIELLQERSARRYRASGLNLIVAAIILWNTVYLEGAIDAWREHGIAIVDESLIHLSPIGWEHVNLTGDYPWQAAGRLRKGGFRPLRRALVNAVTHGNRHDTSRKVYVQLAIKQ